MARIHRSKLRKSQYQKCTPRPPTISREASFLLVGAQQGWDLVGECELYGPKAPASIQTICVRASKETFSSQAVYTEWKDFLGAEE